MLSTAAREARSESLSFRRDKGSVEQPYQARIEDTSFFCRNLLDRRAAAWGAGSPLPGWSCPGPRVGTSPTPGSRLDCGSGAATALARRAHGASTGPGLDTKLRPYHSELDSSDSAAISFRRIVSGCS